MEDERPGRAEPTCSSRPYVGRILRRLLKTLLNAGETIPCGEAEHKLNLFFGNNETAKNEFAKRDPDLAKFYQEEAQPVEIPIFGKNKNLTVASKLVKDPSIAGPVQLAARIHENWLAEDRLAAQRQRAAAGAMLKRLEAATVA